MTLLQGLVPTKAPWQMPLYLWQWPHPLKRRFFAACNVLLGLLHFVVAVATSSEALSLLNCGIKRSGRAHATVFVADATLIEELNGNGVPRLAGAHAALVVRAKATLLGHMPL